MHTANSASCTAQSALVDAQLEHLTTRAFIWLASMPTFAGRTALHVASVGGHADCAAQLLQKGAATNIADGQGSAALHLAAVRGHVDVVQKLLAYRAPTGQRDKQNCTAMLLATREGKIPTAELLVSAEANVDAADSHGRTPLMHACRQGAAGLVKALLRRGALVNVRDNEGNTAKEFAVRGSHRECADLLPQNAHMGNLAAAATAPPSGDVSSAALEIELETLKAEITKERETLAAEKAAHAITKADIVQMQAQIAAFAPEDDDDNDVSFDSDDGAVDDGADAAGPALADVAKLRGQLTTLRMENARLKAVGSGATEEVADLPSAQEVTRLKQQVAELEGLLTERDGKGGTASVPISVYQSLKVRATTAIDASSIASTELQPIFSWLCNFMECRKQIARVGNKRCVWHGGWHKRLISRRSARPLPQQLLNSRRTKLHFLRTGAG